MKHDEFVRYAMSDPALCAAFFKHFMSELAGVLDFDQLKQENGSYVAANLRRTITDLHYQVPLQEDNEVRCAILMEHKSGGSARPGTSSLVFQLRVQEVALLQHYSRENPGKKLPIVFLVGLYHGPRPYAGPRTVAELIAGPPDLIPARWSQNDTLLIDLNQFDESKLEEGKLSLFLSVLKIIYDADFIDKFKAMLPRLKNYDVSHEGREFLIALNHYLLSNARWESLPEFREIAVKSYSEEVGGAVMTIAELLKKEGRTEGRMEVAKTMVRRGMDWETIADITGLPQETIAMLAKQAS